MGFSMGGKGYAGVDIDSSIPGETFHFPLLLGEQNDRIVRTSWNLLQRLAATINVRCLGGWTCTWECFQSQPKTTHFTVQNKADVGRRCLRGCSKHPPQHQWRIECHSFLNGHAVRRVSLSRSRSHHVLSTPRVRLALFGHPCECVLSTRGWRLA